MKPPSEGFRKVRKLKTKSSESFRKKEALSERTPEHTLTVREAQEICKKSSIGVTERTIINWCHPNDKGFARLDAWKDPNDDKWYLTPRSVEFVILEEQNKLKIKARSASSELPHDSSERFGNASENTTGFSESFGRFPKSSEASVVATNEQPEMLKQELLDLKITNRGKDQILDFLQRENRGLIHELKEQSRTIGQLETKLKQLEGPKQNMDNEKGAAIEGEVVETSKQNEQNENRGEAEIA